MTKQTIGIAGLKVIHAEPPKPAPEPTPQPVTAEVKKEPATKPKRSTKPKPTDNSD